MEILPASPLGPRALRGHALACAVTSPPRAQAWPTGALKGERQVGAGGEAPWAAAVCAHHRGGHLWLPVQGERAGGVRAPSCCKRNRERRPLGGSAWSPPRPRQHAEQLQAKPNGPGLSRSIPCDRNVNCSIDLLLRLHCLFNSIFLAGNFLIKNPVIEKPQKPTATPEPGGHAGTAPRGLLPRPAPPPASLRPKLLHLPLRVNACDLQLHRG